MHKDLKLSLAIINCYPKTSRENFDKQNVGHPHNLYMDAIKRYVPNAEFDLIFVADSDTELPTGANLNSYDGYIWTGSDLTLYKTDDERVTRQVELSKAIYEAGVPAFGSCWALQMAVWASGGDVKANPKGREWSVARNITKTDAGKESMLLKGKPDVYDGFIMHLDEVTTLSSGTILLATNDHSHVQAVEVKHKNGTFWATQYHPEYTFFEMARLIQARANPLVKEGFFEAVEDVQKYADAMFALHHNPDSDDLRSVFKVGDDIIDADIRQQEIRNWIDYLVLPSLRTDS
jgi:GMP synthase (glutamine-hydrolysing)